MSAILTGDQKDHAIKKVGELLRLISQKRFLHDDVNGFLSLLQRLTEPKAVTKLLNPVASVGESACLPVGFRPESNWQLLFGLFLYVYNDGGFFKEKNYPLEDKREYRPVVRKYEFEGATTYCQAVKHFEESGLGLARPMATAIYLHENPDSYKRHKILGCGCSNRRVPCFSLDRSRSLSNADLPRVTCVSVEEGRDYVTHNKFNPDEYRWLVSELPTKKEV